MEALEDVFLVVIQWEEGGSREDPTGAASVPDIQGTSTQSCAGEETRLLEKGSEESVADLTRRVTEATRRVSREPHDSTDGAHHVTPFLTREQASAAVAAVRCTGNH